VFLLYLN